MLNKRLGTFFIYAFVLLGVVISLFPFYWLFVMSTRTSAEFFRFPPVMIPGTNLGNNFASLSTVIDFTRSLVNSLIVATVKTVSALFLCSMAAFYFAKFRFPGNRLRFGIILISMMIPSQLLMIPQLIMMGRMGLVSSLWALILPTLVPAFGIFWMRQYCTGAIHDDLIHAGRIDGCNTFRLFWNVGFPIMTPGLAFLAIHTFMTAWNDFLWPLIVLSDQKNFTVQVALGQLQGMHTKTDYGAVTCGALLATLPLIALFLGCNRFFIAGIASGSIKD